MSAEPPIPDAQQTRAERELLRAVKAGDEADVTKYPEAEKKVRPELLRWLCLNSADRNIVDGHGIFLEGGKITGILDLNYLNIVVPLYLLNCTLGHLELRSARTRELCFKNSNFSDGIIAQGVRASRWFMDDAKIIGAFNINSAELTGQLNANNATFNGNGGVAIHAQGVKATDWFMNYAMVRGTFDINGAVLLGQFCANCASFDGKDSEAIRALGVKAGSWFMRGLPDDRVTVKGMLDFNHAEINQVEFDNAEFFGSDSVALRLDSSRIETLYAGRGFSVEGTVDVDHAEIKKCGLGHARLKAQNESVVLSAEFAQIGRLDLPRGIRDDKTGCVLPAVQGSIDLTRAKIGTLVDAADGWFPPQKITDKKAAANISYIMLDGTEYDYLANPDGYNKAPPSKHGRNWKARRDWLLSQRIDRLTERFNPQPWTQLAQTLARMGYQDDARHIAIERRKLQSRSEDNWWLRRVSDLLRLSSGYGFYPWHTVGWSLLFFAAFALYYVYLGQCLGDCAMHFDPSDLQNSLIRGGFMAVDGDLLPAAGEKAKAAFYYPTFNPWLYSLDLFIPILDLGSDSYWRPISLGGYLVTVFEQIIGAIMVALAITGFSGLLTSDDKL